ncbi:MAG: hypothetical protein H3C26_14285 [Rhodocyclaceae bacterium]|nr:hypothetical protein [Rhodocyclaceae bacterium]
MLCLEDCLELCELEQDEVVAIAEHEHVPVIVAAELGCQLLKTDEGVARLHTMILDDIEDALEHGHTERAGELLCTYQHFRHAHPLPISSL